MVPTMTGDAVEAYRRLVQRALGGRIPEGEDFNACRAVLRSGATGQMAFQALCMLLEGVLADPALDIDDAQRLVPLLKDLASGTVRVEELL
jgi:hypothetical protein